MKSSIELYFGCQNDSSDNQEPINIDEGRTTGNPSPKRK